MEKSLPKKTETLVFCEMSPLQRETYKKVGPFVGPYVYMYAHRIASTAANKPPPTIRPRTPPNRNRQN